MQSHGNCVPVFLWFVVIMWFDESSYRDWKHKDIREKPTDSFCCYSFKVKEEIGFVKAVSGCKKVVTLWSLGQGPTFISAWKMLQVEETLQTLDLLLLGCDAVGTYQRFGGTFCVCLQGWRCWLCFSETMVSIYESTRRQNSQEERRHGHRRDNLKSDVTDSLLNRTDLKNVCQGIHRPIGITTNCIGNLYLLKMKWRINGANYTIRKFTFFFLFI
jgi:hypothetical protein